MPVYIITIQVVTETCVAIIRQVGLEQYVVIPIYLADSYLSVYLTHTRCFDFDLD